MTDKERCERLAVVSDDMDREQDALAAKQDQTRADVERMNQLSRFKEYIFQITSEIRNGD